MQLNVFVYTRRVGSTMTKCSRLPFIENTVYATLDLITKRWTRLVMRLSRGWVPQYTASLAAMPLTCASSWGRTAVVGNTVIDVDIMNADTFCKPFMVFVGLTPCICMIGCRLTDRELWNRPGCRDMAELLHSRAVRLPWRNHMFNTSPPIL